MTLIDTIILAGVLLVWVVMPLFTKPPDLRPPTDAERARLPFPTRWRRDDEPKKLPPSPTE